MKRMRMCGGAPLLLVIAALVVATEASAWNVRPQIVNEPIANPRSVVLAGNARFTVLTSRLIRLEYSQNKKFVDDASLVFINRNLSVPEFVSKTTNTITVVNTQHLKLSYNSADGAISARSLNISFSFNGKTVTWFPGTKNEGDLGGTVSTLDCYNQKCENGSVLQPGLISRSGWALIDDTRTPLFDNVKSAFPWIETPSKRGSSIDWYFFAYGLEFKDLLFDYTLVAGPITIPPASAFGSWWSRYWEYNEQTITNEIILGYKNHSLPLNHLVLDMDWHTEEKNSQCQTWGGYTWNTALFPNPQKFIDYVHGPENNLKLLLNIHPQTGVDVCQTKYEALAKALNFDSSKNKTIQCDWLSQELTSKIFPIVLNPVGPDYWWTDFYGCSNGEDIPGEYNLLWSNIVFDSELSSIGKRPLVLSRYGGLGNHRYPIGFSGDTNAVWPSLSFLVYMTPVAANVLFAYWSHDTGGFQGDPSDEMFLRWLQFASVEPIYRIHSDHKERRIWTFPSYEAMKQTMIFRNSLGPYIYTQARKTYDTGVAAVHPLYYEFPNYTQSYDYKYQYMFGDDIFAAPVVSPGNPATNKTSKALWLPPGSWFSLIDKKLSQGPQDLVLEVPFTEIPIYVRAGSIIPMKDMRSVTNYHPDPLIFSIYPGATSGTTEYYEDEPDTTAYLNGEYAFISVNYTLANKMYKIDVSAARGAYKSQPATRTFQIALIEVRSLTSATFIGKTGSIPMHMMPLDGEGVGWWFSPASGLVLQTPNNVGAHDAFTIRVDF